MRQAQGLQVPVLLSLSIIFGGMDPSIVNAADGTVKVNTETLKEKTRKKLKMLLKTIDEQERGIRPISDFFSPLAPGGANLRRDDIFQPGKFRKITVPQRRVESIDVKALLKKASDAVKNAPKTSAPLPKFKPVAPDAAKAVSGLDRLQQNQKDLLDQRIGDIIVVPSN